jgi:hypothetical protein
MKVAQKKGPGRLRDGLALHGIHEVTGSIPVRSTILRSPSASFGSVNQASIGQAKDAAP